jgi:ubiquinone/menaquinone biosynthesis C-methylase UbiE
MLNRIIFSLWYLGRPPWDSGISPPELLEFINAHPQGRAIDLGCGTGTNVITLARAGWQVTGMDFAARAVQKAKRKTKLAKVSADLFVGDVTHIKTDSHFDLALDIGCFHGISDHTAYLDGLSRLLNRGGHWLMYGFFKSDPGQSGPGLVDSDLDMISAHSLTLLWRKDGTDKCQRPSAWFLYKKM